MLANCLLFVKKKRRILQAVVRNGYLPKRTIVTGIGKVAVQEFNSSLLPPLSQAQCVIWVVGSSRFPHQQEVTSARRDSSVELQLAERLWPLTHQAIANRAFANLDELEAASAHRCQVLLKRRDLIKGLTNFYWWAVAVG